jgi:hypothetical protein
MNDVNKTPLALRYYNSINVAAKNSSSKNINKTNTEMKNQIIEDRDVVLIQIIKKKMSKRLLKD